MSSIQKWCYSLDNEFVGQFDTSKDAILAAWDEFEKEQIAQDIDPLLAPFSGIIGWRVGRYAFSDFVDLSEILNLVAHSIGSQLGWSHVPENLSIEKGFGVDFNPVFYKDLENSFVNTIDAWAEDNGLLMPWLEVQDVIPISMTELHMYRATRNK